MGRLTRPKSTRDKAPPPGSRRVEFAARGPAGPIEDDRLARALTEAKASGRVQRLLDELERLSGLPSPRPNVGAAHAMALAMITDSKWGSTLARAWAELHLPHVRHVLAFYFAERALTGDQESRDDLLALAEDEEHVVRQGSQAALEFLLRQQRKLDGLQAWADSLLGAHILLEALTAKEVLQGVSDAAAVLEFLARAFDLADDAPRSAERSQGLRLLRSALPRQIARVIGRFPEGLEWLEGLTSRKNVETREIVRQALAQLKSTRVGDAGTRDITAKLNASEPIPRNIARVVQGMRGRGKKRRG